MGETNTWVSVPCDDDSSIYDEREKTGPGGVLYRRSAVLNYVIVNAS